MKFQQVIESILADVSRTYPFIDDINSSGDTPLEFITILRDVLTRLSDASVRLNPKKTRLGFLDAEILGRHVSHNSVSLTDDRKRTILGIPTFREFAQADALFSWSSPVFPAFRALLRYPCCATQRCHLWLHRLSVHASPR